MTYDTLQKGIKTVVCFPDYSVKTVISVRRIIGYDW
jgi:hypothetical protein